MLLLVQRLRNAPAQLYMPPWVKVNSNHTSLGALRIPRPDCCKSNPLVSGHEGLKCWSLLPASMVKQNCSVRLKIHFPITDLSFYCWWLKWLRLCGILWKFKFHLNISSLYHSKAAKNFDPLVITIRRVPSLECFTCDTLQKLKIPNPARNC